MVTFIKSPLKNKKYRAILPNNKHVDFGDSRYQQYKDTTGLGLYTHKDHLDKERRRLYRLRHKRPTNKNTAGYFSWKYLW